MGKTSIERKIHYLYAPALLAHWNEQTEEFKDYCNSLGEPRGYSGQNVFLSFFIQYWNHKEADTERLSFESEL